MRLLRLLLGVMIFIAGSCVTANACQCLLQAPACADYWRADAVFVGSVTNIAPSFDDLEASMRTKNRKVALIVEKAYRGSIGSHVDLEDWINSCEFRFEKGRKYLIYAYRNVDDNTLGTHGCSRTTALSNATEDLAYIDAFLRGKTEQNISGIIQNPFSEKPVRGITIVANAGGQRFQSLSRRDGTFKIPVPRPGRYIVKIYFPRDYSIGGPGPYIERIKNVATAKQTVVEYDLNLAKGQCEFLVVPALRGP